MAHSSVHTEVSTRSPSLTREKVGVIGGFLAGLVVGLGPVMSAMDVIDAPFWVSVLALSVVVAATTHLGLRLSR